MAHVLVSFARKREEVRRSMARGRNVVPPVIPDQNRKKRGVK